MDPQLITKLKQAFKKNGINIESDVNSYANSLKLNTDGSGDPIAATSNGEKQSPPTTGQSSTATSNQFTALQQQLSKLVNSKLPAPLMPFKDKFANKVQTISSYPELKIFAADLLDIIHKSQKAVEAGPKVAQAVTQSMTMFIKQAEQKNPAQTDQTQNKFVRQSNIALSSKAESLKLVELYPNIKSYRVNGSEPVQVKVPYGGATDLSMLIGLPMENGSEALVLGFAANRYSVWLTSDSGRVAQSVLGHIFDIKSGPDTQTLKAAIKTSDGTIQKGQIQLPLP